MMSTTSMLVVTMSVLTSINALALDSPSQSSTPTLFGHSLDGNNFKYVNRSSPSAPLLPSASNTEISQSSHNSLMTSLLNLQSIIAFVIMPATNVNSRPQFTHNGPQSQRVVSSTSPKDCVTNDAKEDECEEIVKDDSPNLEVSCRNSDQRDTKSLKVCTFTHYDDTTTHATTSPTVQHKQCIISKAGGRCETVCKGLWSRGFFSSKTEAFKYSLGKSYDCAFTIKTDSQEQRWKNEKLVCSCAQLATRKKE